MRTRLRPGRSAVRVTVKRVPQPGALSTVIGTRSLQATWRTMARPEAGGAAIMLHGFFRAVVIFKDPRQLLPGDANAPVAHGDQDVAGATSSARDIDDAIVIGVIDGVDDQVVDQHGQVVFHRLDRARLDVLLKTHASLARGGFDRASGPSRSVGPGSPPPRRRRLALRPQVGQLEHFLNLAGQDQAAGGDLLDRGAGWRGRVAAIIAEEQLA